MYDDDNLKKIPRLNFEGVQLTVDLLLSQTGKKKECLWMLQSLQD